MVITTPTTTTTTTTHHPPSMAPLHHTEDTDHHYPTTTSTDYNPLSLKRRRTINNNTNNNNNSSINSLLNFSSLPCFNVKWGRQKHLRCIKPSSSSSRSTHYPINSLQPHKLFFNFHFLNKSSSPPPNDVIIPHADKQRPWNLRTRRAVCKHPPYSLTHSNAVNPPVGTLTPTPTNFTDTNAVNLNPDVALTKKRKPFSGCLSKREIEQDFLTMLGSRPPRRPKKRPKLVQRLLDGVTPGLWLSEITADMYKVNEQQQPDTSKR